MAKASINIGSVTRTGKGRASKVSSFSIEGLDELIQAFAQLPDDAIHKLSAPSVDAAEKVAERAKSKVRNRTGDLANAITVKKPGKPKNKKAYQIFAKVSFKKEGMHGVPLELGHRLWYFGKPTYSNVPEKPFMRPAADESKEEVAGIMAEAMRSTIDEMGGMR